MIRATSSAVRPKYVFDILSRVLETKICASTNFVSVPRPYRLAVRTPGSHPGNPGSIPGRVTMKLLQMQKEFDSLFRRSLFVYSPLLKMSSTHCRYEVLGMLER